VKTRKARIETKDVIIVAEYGDHDDSDKVSNVADVALRVSCKAYRAAKDIILVPVQDHSDCTILFVVVTSADDRLAM